MEASYASSAYLVFENIPLFEREDQRSMRDELKSGKFIDSSIVFDDDTDAD